MNTWRILIKMEMEKIEDLPKKCKRVSNTFYIYKKEIRFWNGKRLLCKHQKNKSICKKCKGIYTEQKTIKSKQKIFSKGSQCSVSGHNYEKKIHNICKNSYLNDSLFNTQTDEELGGCSTKNDIECNFNKEKDIGIEIKKSKSPDWMQCSIKYNKEKNEWQATENGKIPKKCQELFNKLINNINLYDGDVPPFMNKSITHEEWINIKKQTNKWNDKYITIPSNTICKLYKEKGCDYIQISDGYGLYHLGNDICNFGVPLFDIEEQIRIRTKIHTRKNEKGFCSLSVTIACQPKNIKKLLPSTYSLDDKEKLPYNLMYKI